MDIIEATERYERWLGTHIQIVPDDLALKHELMAQTSFAFLRATYYRWIQYWNDAEPDLLEGPKVLSVGDLHIENFGTWRDAEGRLIWGINDFDEAFPLTWTADLVRLAASARLAVQAQRLALRPGSACDAILDGYTACLRATGRPFVLAENHAWLRTIALGKLRDPERFWSKLEALQTLQDSVPASASNALRHLLPERDLVHRVAHRVAGLGSLGRQRFVALAGWHGGQIAREAKALAPSACTWTEEHAEPREIYYQTLIDSAIRVPDPMIGVLDGWVVRRLAPDCARVELDELPDDRSESRLLYAMGFETGNIHLADPALRSEILANLESRPSNWLRQAAKAMIKLVEADFEAWRSRETPGE